MICTVTTAPPIRVGVQPIGWVAALTGPRRVARPREYRQRPAIRPKENDPMTTTPATAKKPQDRKPSKQRAEALDTEVTFAFDGEEWTLTPADATSLEFLAALEDNQIIAALRVLLGRDQAARLIKGRRVEDLEGFFEAMGEVTGSGNL